MPPEDAFAIPLSDADIQEFIEIYKQEFKIGLSAKEASEIASGVPELYRILIRRNPWRRQRENGRLRAAIRRR